MLLVFASNLRWFPVLVRTVRTSYRDGIGRSWRVCCATANYGDLDRSEFGRRLMLGMRNMMITMVAEDFVLMRSHGTAKRKVNLCGRS